ncbi:hypothetical protein ACLB2K_067967 [Fragaria x ananassa]
MAGRSCYRDVLPFTAIVTVESTNVGLNILFKSATSKGLSYYVFIVYSYAFATLLLLPLPFIFSSRTRLPPLNFSLLWKNFLLGLIGFVANLCAYKGYRLHFTNSCFRHEQPHSGFYIHACCHLQVVYCSLLGTFCSLPGLYFSTSLLLVAETNLSAWRLRPGIALIAVIYSGFFSTAFSTIVVTWSLNLKGPVYVSIFKPLSIGIAAASSVIFLSDDLFLGSVVGAVMISIGFYGVIWGQAKEEEMRDQDYDFDNLRGLHSGNAPLLETYKVESM